MTTKTLSNAYPGGYAVSPAYGGLVIENGVFIGGTGLLSSARYLTLSNAGTVDGGAGAAGQYQGGNGFAAVSLEDGGAATNTGAMTGGAGGAGQFQYGGAGGIGIKFNQSGSLNNFATIQGGAGGYGSDLGGNGGLGVSLLAAGSGLDNASTGMITGGAGGKSGPELGGDGGRGIAIHGIGYNQGAITGGAGGGGYRAAGWGGAGAYVSGGALTNTGLITGGAGGVARFAIDNGTGGAGVILSAASLANAGTISAGAGGVSGYARAAAGDGADNGVVLLGGAVTNGAAGDTTAKIVGVIGVSVSGAGTVTNYGIIDGTGGTAIRFGAAGDHLIVESGASFVGQVYGGGGTLEFGGGADTVSGTGTLTGAAAGTFTAFGYYAVDAGASLTVAADASITLAGTFQNAGTVRALGGKGFAGLAIAAAGATLTGGGQVILGAQGVIEDAAAGGTLTNVDNTISGGGFVETPLTLMNDAAGIIDADSGRMLINVAGTVTNAGLIEATGGGILLLSNTTLDSSGGGRVEDGKQIQLNKATLLGGTLTIDKGASILPGAFASTINLEGGTVTNAGTLEGAGGGLTVDGDIANTGLVIAETGALTITGAVTGTGKIEVFGKQTLEIDGAQGGAIAFGAGSTGRLVLADSAAFNGTLTGLSKTGANSIDLKDIAYGTGDTVTFMANTNANTGGVLKVSDGTNTATIKLAGGNYAKSTFALGQDAGIGIIVTDPTAHAFVAAMAGFAPAAGSGGHAGASASPSSQRLSLAAPMT